MFKRETSAAVAISSIEVMTPPPRPGFLDELASYFGRFRLFTRRDWAVYIAWVGLISGLALASAAFLAIGRHAGAVFPAHAYFIPIGAAIFALAIAVDTIGHRTVYKNTCAAGRAWSTTSSSSAASPVACFCARPIPHRAPAASGARSHHAVFHLQLRRRGHALAALPDRAKSDVVEMWSHVFILIGHG
jgi:hypothetical protein